MRDELSQRVADNLVALMAHQGLKPHNLQTRINDARDGDGRSTSVSDFLKEPTDNSQRKRAVSPRISTLAEFAEGLGVDPIAFFLPPDKRDGLLLLLNTLYTVHPDYLGQIRQIVESFPTLKE